MIGQECIDELADYVGMKAHVAAITERAMRGEIEFEPALRERVALLEGAPDAKIVHAGHRRAHHLDAGRPRSSCAPCGRTAPTPALVSGGFTLFTGRIAERSAFTKTAPMC